MLLWVVGWPVELRGAPHGDLCLWGASTLTPKGWIKREKKKTEIPGIKQSAVKALADPVSRHPSDGLVAPEASECGICGVQCVQMLFGVYVPTYTKIFLSDTTQTLIVSKNKNSDLDIISALECQKGKKKKRLKVAQHRQSAPRTNCRVFPVFRQARY